MPGVAVKVTDEPGQKGFVGVAMLTPAGKLLISVIVKLLLDAGLPEVQASEEVRIQNTWSPFDGMKVKLELLLPALTPLTFH